jgi:purine nucleosidase
MQRIIVDTDAGIDDAMALLYALRSPGVRIEAITTVHGNVAVEVATQNIFEILHVSGLKELPVVAQGSAMPLRSGSAHPVTAQEVHGEDGLGGWTKRGRVPRGAVADAPGAQLILSIARQYPGEVTLVTLGPLTNAATAFREDPAGFRMLKEAVVMGGAVWAPGNITAVAEFNIFLDPEAAHEMLHCGVPATIVGLDVTSEITITPDRVERWLQSRSDLTAEFLECVCGQLFRFYRRLTGSAKLHPHDALAMGVALDRALVRTLPMKVDVETGDGITRGMVVAERREWLKGGENANVCREVHTERFLELFGSRVFG